MNDIAVFADVQNLFYTTRDIFARPFNYREFWKQVSSRANIVTANAYAIQSRDDRQIKFQDALHHIGFNVKLKPFIQRSDGSAKGDWDVGITIDVMEAAREIKHIILLSGDGDFDLLVKKIKTDYDVYVEVFGVEALTAKSLIDTADEFHPITESLLVSAAGE